MPFSDPSYVKYGTTMTQFKKTSMRFFFSIASGLLVAACFPGIHTEFLSLFLPVALVPFFICLFSVFNEKNTIKKLFFYSWIFGFSLQLPAFFWICQPIIFFSSVKSIVAYPLTVLICALTALYFPLLFSPFFWHAHRYRSAEKIPLFSFALILTFLEIVIPCFFNWSFGSLMYSQLYPSQLSSLFGFHTGSLFIFWTGLSFAHGIFFFKKNPFLKTVLMQSLVWISICAFGFFRVWQFDHLENKSDTRIAYVQPNFTFNSIASLPLPAKDSQHQSLERLLEMSHQAVQKALDHDGRNPDLMVWPESAAPDLFLLDAKQISLVSQWSEQHHMPVLVQALQWKQEDLLHMSIDDAPVWSASVIVNEHGLQPESFQKWVPMPFGEMFPLETTFPILGKWYRSLFKNPSKLEVGTSYDALAYGQNLSAAPLICFDAIDQRLPYLQSKKGNASIFVNQANFVWMVDSNAGTEFSMLDRARSIENARSSVMVSNTGPTTAFDPVGRIILPAEPLLTQATGYVDLPLSKEQTFFSKFYWTPLFIAGLLALVFYAALSFRDLTIKGDRFFKK